MGISIFLCKALKFIFPFESFLGIIKKSVLSFFYILKNELIFFSHDHLIFNIFPLRNERFVHLP